MLNEEQYLLVSLMEECDEVSQRCAKALRFGLTEAQAGQDLTNAERIRDEINDLVAIIDLLERRGALPLSGAPGAIEAKQAKVARYAAYARERGTLAA